MLSSGMLNDGQHTAIGPVPDIIVAPAEFTTSTETVPVVIPRKEKPLNPGDSV